MSKPNNQGLKKILVIENNPEIILNIQEILDASSFKIYGGENYEHGISLAKNVLPDLIFCQYSLPLLDGCDIISILRDSKETKNIPILLMMKASEVKDIRCAFDLGIDDYLIYPFSAQELSSIVNLRIKRQEQQTSQVGAERTKSLQLQRDLDVLKKQLKEVRQFNLIKSNLIGKISTDLRDPLSNINMATKMLLQSRDAEERARYLSILESECAREIQILNEVDTLHSILTLENMEVLNRFSLLSS